MSRSRDALEAGITKRAEMAELLELDVEEIDNAQKRLKGRVEKALKALENEKRKGGS